MSSGTTWSRPARIARARAAWVKAMLPRGLAPNSTYRASSGAM